MQTHCTAAIGYFYGILRTQGDRYFYIGKVPVTCYTHYMRSILLALIVILTVSSPASAVPSEAEWGHTGSGKVWLNDPALISRATSPQTAQPAALWPKILVGAAFAGLVIYWFKTRE